MRGVNHCTLLGNVGNDVDLKFTQDGTAIAKFSLATTEIYKGRDGEKKEDVSWHRCVAFGKLAELIGEYVKKGDPLFIEGQIRYGSYEKDGVKHYTTDIRVNEMRLLGGKRDEGSGNGTPRRNAPAKRREPEQGKQSFDDVPFDDDIPFATNRGMY